MKINSLQALRYFAALIVLLYHVSKHAPSGSVFMYFQYGYAGVDVFFVLSGFVIALSTSRKKRAFHLRKFYFSRFARIYPAYWVFLFFPLMVIALVFPQYSPSPRVFGSWEIVFTFLLVFGHPVVSQVTWTLSYELYFYLLYGVLFKSRKVFVLAFYGILIIFLLMIVNVYKIPCLKHLANPIVLEFFAGVYAYKLAEGGVKGVKLPVIVLVIGVIVFFVSLGGYWGVDNMRTYRYVFFGVPSFLLILSLALLEEKGAIRISEGLLTRLGDSSYVMYLIHSPLVSFFALFISDRYFDIGMSFLAVIVTFLSLCLYVVIDRPMCRKFNSYVK